MTKYQLAAADREKFDDLPEWIAFDRETLDDTPYSVLSGWEQEIRREDPDTSILRIVYTEWPAKTAIGVKGYLWLALKLTGGECPSWQAFDIRVTGISALVGGSEGSDPNPLEETSSAAQPAAEE